MDKLSVWDICDAFSMDAPEDLWFSEDCNISKNGIFPNTLGEKTMGIQNGEKIFTGTERREWNQFEQVMFLPLPCTGQEFCDWVIRNDFLIDWGTMNGLTDGSAIDESDEAMIRKELEMQLLGKYAGYGVGGHSEVTERLTGKKRRKRKLMGREMDDLTSLFYQMFDEYGIQYLDEMPAPKAWEKIVSETFKSTYILVRPDLTNDVLVLNDKKRITKDRFYERYRRRFGDKP